MNSKDKNIECKGCGKLCYARHGYCIECLKKTKRKGAGSGRLKLIKLIKEKGENGI